MNFIITFNLRTTEVEVIDHSKAAVEFHVKYGGTPFLLRHLFAKYLSEVGHPKAMFIRSTIPKRKIMKWRTSEHHFGYGVFMMKHMESYKGQINWDCQLAFEGDEQNKQIENLRRKYATKILLSDLNLLKEEFCNDLQCFNKHYCQKEKEFLSQTAAGKCFIHFSSNLVN